MKINSISDIGQSRKENQDNYWSAILRVDDKETGVVCMCDGMGGLDNGGLASKIITESIRDCILSGVALYKLTDIIVNANKTIFSMSSSGSRMGSTCTVLVCQEGKYYLHHIGDSRCYKISENKMYQLSVDHSVINDYGITKENNRELYEKYKNKLTRCLGVKPTVTVDTSVGEYTDGDIFLLCSDGFWHYFEESNYSLQLDDLSCCIKECIKHGETDNISVSLLYT